MIFSSAILVDSQVYAYTTTAAEEAFDAFQEHFYNPNTKLYWNNSDHQNIAAIWTHPIYWNMILDAYERTGDMKYYNLSNDIYQGGYEQYAQYDWDNQTVWFVFDDLMWWIISMTRSYLVTGNTAALDTAIEGFDNVYNRAYDSVNGGVFWGFGPDGMGRGHKNSCINYPTIIAAVRLYQATGDIQYLDFAEELYDWAMINLFNPSTGSVPDLISDQGVQDLTTYTYNQGTMIGAASLLYLETNDITYLNNANLAAQYTRDVMSNSQGILPAEGDWNEQGVMKAIFANYISILIEDCGQTQWLPWIYNNIDTAWSNRDTSRNLMYRDYTVRCSDGMLQSYEASSAVAFMQVFASNEVENKQSIATPSVTVYQNSNYGGNSFQLRPGRYNKEALTAAGVPSNWLTSLQLPAGCVIQIFSQDNFSGTMWEHTISSSNVGHEQNDKMVSCIIYYNQGVTFYESDLFRGNAVTLTKGSYTLSELQSFGIGNDWVTSLAVPDGWNVRLFKDDFYQGNSTLLNRGTHNLGSGLNDTTTSVKIF